jgi:hypothetical protein
MLSPHLKLNKNYKPCLFIRQGLRVRFDYLAPNFFAMIAAGQNPVNAD